MIKAILVLIALSTGVTAYHGWMDFIPTSSNNVAESQDSIVSRMNAWIDAHNVTVSRMETLILRYEAFANTAATAVAPIWLEQDEYIYNGVSKPISLKYYYAQVVRVYYTSNGVVSYNPNPVIISSA